MMRAAAGRPMQRRAAPTRAVRRPRTLWVTKRRCDGAARAIGTQDLPAQRPATAAAPGDDDAGCSPSGVRDGVPDHIGSSPVSSSATSTPVVTYRSRRPLSKAPRGAAEPDALQRRRAVVAPGELSRAPRGRWSVIGRAANRGRQADSSGFQPHAVIIPGESPAQSGESRYRIAASIVASST